VRCVELAVATRDLPLLMYRDTSRRRSAHSDLFETKNRHYATGLLTCRKGVLDTITICSERTKGLSNSNDMVIQVLKSHSKCAEDEASINWLSSVSPSCYPFTIRRRHPSKRQIIPKCVLAAHSSNSSSTSTFWPTWSSTRSDSCHISMIC
jgi:hypothetical protein